MKLSKILLVLFLWPFVVISAENTEGRYRVVHISDGDTFDATDGHITFRVRMIAMDAPESRQSFGQWATTELKKSIEGKVVVLQSVGKRPLDKYNRVLGQVFVDGKDISLSMIEKGFATYYRPRCKNYPEDKGLYTYDPRPYVEAEAKARAAGLGVWSEKNWMLPCQFRKEK